MDGRPGRKPRSLTRQLTWSIIGIIVLFALLGSVLSFVGGYREASRLQDHHLHDIGVAGDFLLVAASEGLDVQIGKELFHFPVGELRTLNSGRRRGAFDGGYASQGGKPVRCDTSDRAPGTLEFINSTDEFQHLWGYG